MQIYVVMKTQIFGVYSNLKIYLIYEIKLYLKQTYPIFIGYFEVYNKYSIVDENICKWVT